MGDRSTLGACSGVMDDVEPGVMVLGLPALPHRQMLREQAALRRLQIVALHRQHGVATDDRVVAVLHPEHVGAQVLERVAEFPPQPAQPLRLPRPVPAGGAVVEFLLVVVLQPSD